ncbi:MAG: peptidoglycan-binding domain-containing protein, partial [Alphaproteobacteria bacterium]
MVMFDGALVRQQKLIFIKNASRERTIMRHSQLVNRMICCAMACVALLLASPVHSANINVKDKPPLSATTTPVAMFPPDDRRKLPHEYNALESKIGMLYEQSTQTLCTAFCVGPGMIATAAHCLFQPKKNQLPKLNDITFRLSYGKIYLTSGIAGRNTPYVKNNIAVGTTSFRNEPPLSAPTDWAIVKLERPICRFGHFKVEPLSVGDVIRASRKNKIFQVAFHWDNKKWQDKLAYSTPCTVKRNFKQIKWKFIHNHFVHPEELILHLCDTGGASSGSPILYDPGLPNNPDTPVVVGINVGTYTRTRILMRRGRIFKRLKPDIIANTGVSSTAFERVISVMKNADIIVSQQDMLKLQAELQMRNYYTNKLDGLLGRGTRSAIFKFETANSLPQTG